MFSDNNSQIEGYKNKSKKKEENFLNDSSQKILFKCLLEAKILERIKRKQKKREKKKEKEQIQS